MTDLNYLTLLDAAAETTTIMSLTGNCIDLTEQVSSKRSSPGMASPEDAEPHGVSEAEQELYRQRILNMGPSRPATAFPNLNVSAPAINTNPCKDQRPRGLRLP